MGLTFKSPNHARVITRHHISTGICEIPNQSALGPTHSTHSRHFTRAMVGDITAVLDSKPLHKWEKLNHQVYWTTWVFVRVPFTELNQGLSHESGSFPWWFIWWHRHQQGVFSFPPMSTLILLYIKFTLCLEDLGITSSATGWDKAGKCWPQGDSGASFGGNEYLPNNIPRELKICQGREHRKWSGEVTPGSEYLNRRVLPSAGWVTDQGCWREGKESRTDPG